MKCISLWNPWAQLIAEGHKTIETRLHDRFKNLAGQTIAIQASKKFDHDATQEIQKFYKGKLGFIYVRALSNKGCIICTAKVEKVGWLDATHSKYALIDCKSTKRFGLFLTDIKTLEKPIPYKGQQGIFEIKNLN